jgi:ATP phosphoribosyltransferase regulatory subunit
MPPFIEYLESLLTGTGNDLDLQSFKLTDQLTGRMMAVRADMTPQAARIDAHPLRREVPSRLCYLGTVLHTRPDGFTGSRSHLQVGAELFGHAGIESDVEILGLVLETLSLLAIPDVHMDLGHVGIFRSLAAEAGLNTQIETALFEALQRKAATEIRDILAESPADEAQSGRLASLANLNGGWDVLDEARERLSGAGPEVMLALEYLRSIAGTMRSRAGDTTLFFDLAELRGYHYHTGMVFAVFVPGCGQEIARGGRYDDIGKVFGRARPATGFSTDLRTLMDLSQRDFGTREGAILAPADDDEELHATMAGLRRAGERVIVVMPGQVTDTANFGCDRILRKESGKWAVKPLQHE